MYDNQIVNNRSIDYFWGNHTSVRTRESYLARPSNTPSREHDSLSEFHCIAAFLAFQASQMWLLGRYLPLMIGSTIPDDDEHWMCFTLLLHMMQYLFAPKLSDNDVAVLQEMIMDHHQRFVSLYPDNSVTPKLHYLIHMPRLIHE